MQNNTETRINHLLDKVLWALLAGSVVVGVSEIKEMRMSVEKLNINIAVIVADQASLKEKVDKHEVKIEKLELRAK
jgi:hypothetical protein